MAPTRQPSNKDLQQAIQELDKSLRSEIGTIGGHVMLLQTIVKSLESDLIERRAIEKYQREHPEQNNKGGESWLNKELIKIIGLVLGLAAAIVAWRASV